MRLAKAHTKAQIVMDILEDILLTTLPYADEEYEERKYFKPEAYVQVARHVAKLLYKFWKEDEKERALHPIEETD